MSLVWRILLVSLLLNVLTIGGVQIAVHLSQQQWFQRERSSMLEAVLESLSVLERVYMPGKFGFDASSVRPLIVNSALREVYDDVILTSGRPPYEGVIHLNPRGAVHRDPDSFPRSEIQAGMERSRLVDGLLPVAGGYCYCVRQGDVVAGYVWFVPKHPEAQPTLPQLWAGLIALCAGTLLFGALLVWHVRRAVGRPLQALGDAAAAVGAGRFDVRLPEQAIAELAPVVATFNRMAAQVGDHTATLEQAVRRAVEQAKQQERALVLSSRLASIGTLAAGVAHEINNPIGGMQNAVARLLQAEGLGERQRTYLQLVQDGLQRIGRTARRLLDFAPRAAVAGSISVAAAIDSARALVEHRAQGRQVRIDVDVPASLPRVRGDQHEIQQVVLNLLLNSLDALEERGRGGTITVRAGTEGGKVVFEVADDGPGMAAEDLGRVFDPFFTKKARPDASGLGMSISFAIVQNHGGEIAVDSRPGQGFRTRVVLPANG
ncbi:MAG: HAMP domain-containing histidine kinase [Planctomycetes bacterium]|nr:HAMP domain-containing histidine kinase [Planctomycetota bacterium]